MACAFIAAMLAASCAHHAEPPAASPGVFSPLKIEDWSFQGHAGSLVHTRSYRLFTTARDTELIAAMPSFLERAMDAYTSRLGTLPRPPMPLDTFLMADRRQWETLTKQLMGNDAVTYLRIERGGFSSGGRAAFFPIGMRDTLAIAAHEGWHQYTQRTFVSVLPPWLEEGIATYMESLADEASELDPASNRDRLGQLRRASSRHELMPLPDLLRATPESCIRQGDDAALTYYAQVWALTRFLHDTQVTPLTGLLTDAARGRLGRVAPEAVYPAYFGGVTGAAPAYAAYVERLVAGGD